MRTTKRHALLWMALLSAAAFTWLATPTTAQQATGPGHGNADELLPVDCLLPGKVRKLGKKVTYLTPRMALKTSAMDCEIRGGEYVAYDRASYDTALAVWKPQAESGDAKAQTYVGEIYERGLGTAPDYAEAARWYTLAANQGYEPAMVNLGQLYELGRGVPQDTATAVEWYRRASGLDAFVTAGVPSAEVNRLKQELQQRTQEVESLRIELQRVQEDLKRSQEQRDDRRSEVDQEKGDLVALQSALSAEKAAAAAEREALAAERAELEAQRAAAEASGQEAGATIAQLDSMAANIATKAASLQQQEEAIAKRDAEVAAREQGFAAKQKELAELDEAIDVLKRQAEEQRKQVAAASQQQAPVQVAMAGPTIHLIDPALPLARSSVPVVRTARALDERLVVGRIEAPAGVLTVTVNDAETKLQENGIFQQKIKVMPGGSHVTVIAIDNQGKRDDREFKLMPEGGNGTQVAETPEAAPKAEIPNIDFGNYYALVIGNDAYPKLPNLETASVDAREVSQVLETKYGFQVTRLENATRYQILSALNGMRDKLTEKDNLLIYYAGHGELDEVNMRGHWLPVDAEPDSTANWISNVSLTDLLRSMNAKHVMVVADSCYSGALTRSALARLERGMTREARVSWQKKMVSKRSRMALTSGGLAPVLDGGGGEHSIFAKAFIDVLKRNDDVLEGHRLFSEISALVTWAAEAQRFDQLPQYAPIKYGGHESGDFFFVPRG